MSALERTIKKSLNPKGRLNCLDGFKISRRFSIDPTQMAQITEDLGLKIDNCQLGVFGDIPFKTAEDKILRLLRKRIYKQNSLLCHSAWEVAKKFSLHRVGSCIKNSELSVMHCQLGCFREKKHKEKTLLTYKLN